MTCNQCGSPSPGRRLCRDCRRDRDHEEVSGRTESVRVCADCGTQTDPEAGRYDPDQPGRWVCNDCRSTVTHDGVATDGGAAPTRVRTRRDGYVRFRAWDPQQGRERYAYVHQLLAISEGADPADVFSDGEFHVHHRNRIRWDNRPENLEVRHRTDHAEHHGRVAADGGTTTVDDYSVEDSVNDALLDCCAHCGKTIGGQGGTHGPVVTHAGERFESVYETEPEHDRPLFCPGCYEELDAAARAEAHQTLDEFETGDDVADLDDEPGVPGRAEAVDLRTEQDDQTGSWRRASTAGAVWERPRDRGPGWFHVAFADGDDAHTVFVAGDPPGEIVAWCDCEGFAHGHQSSGWGRSPCAHVCRLAQEASIDRLDLPSLDDLRVGADGDRGQAVADGGVRR